MNYPKVSIIIPVYNGSNYLEEAINSALSQTYVNYEVIVVNDGSNDDGKTEDIAKSFGDKIRYFYKENGGVASALNFALEKMKGEYFSWLSHDDLYYPNKIQRQIEMLQQCDDGARIVYSDYDVLDMTNNQKKSMQLTNYFKKEKLENSVFCLLQQVLHGCTLLIHKSHFERVGGFDEKLITTQDYDLWFKIFSNQRLIYIPESLVVGRVHRDQGSQKISCHASEVEALYTMFINSIREIDKTKLYGSDYNFYYQMYSLCKKNQLNGISNLVKQKLLTLELPMRAYEGQEQIKKYLNDMAGGKDKKICIFCAGDFGKELYVELLRRKIKVDIFCDNDISKQNTYIYNVKCISLDELCSEKDNTLVIVANLSPKEIVDQLISLDIKSVVTKQEVDKVLFEIAPFELKFLE